MQVELRLLMIIRDMDIAWVHTHMQVELAKIHKISRIYIYSSFNVHKQIVVSSLILSPIMDIYISNGRFNLVRISWGFHVYLRFAPRPVGPGLYSNQSHFLFGII